MSQPDVRLVILDNDGVLVDSEPIAHGVLVELLAEYGWRLTLHESVQNFLGVTIGYVRERAEDALGVRLPADFEKRYHQMLFARYETDLRPIPDVAKVVRRLRVPCCVASSGSRMRIQRSLEKTGLWPLFTGRVFSGEEVPRGKPDPDLFLHAADTMGVEPELCVVVEDSPLGIEAASRAAMASVGFAYRTPEARLAGASRGVVHRLLDLPEILPGAF